MLVYRSVSVLTRVGFLKSEWDDRVQSLLRYDQNRLQYPATSYLSKQKKHGMIMIYDWYHIFYLHWANVRNEKSCYGLSSGESVQPPEKGNKK